jgi:hypothetical protein
MGGYVAGVADAVGAPSGVGVALAPVESAGTAGLAESDGGGVAGGALEPPHPASMSNETAASFGLDIA